MALNVRPEHPQDFAAIDRVHDLAFGAPGEARLVRALRERATHYSGLVADEGGEVLGHLAFSEVAIAPTPVRTPWIVEGAAPTLGLAPLGVLPGHQRRGIGAALVTKGLDGCRLRGARLVFVLGHAAYYPRFGFVPAAPAGFHWASHDHDPSFFVLELTPGAAAGRAGWVHYHPAFDLVT